MKKNKITIAVIALIILIILPVLLFRAYTYTFSNFLPSETNVTVFYPQGVANEYKSIMVNGNEDHRIWKYKLNKKEAEALKSDLSKDVWQTVSSEESKYINEAYFAKQYFEFTKSDEIYYCLYDLDEGSYKNITVDDTILFGQKNLLFLYNAADSEYYCVSKIS